MNSDPSKVAPSHLQRNAYLYVRQSTLRQVVENTESTQRQYALRERAIALGWPIERVLVIDNDQGQSGATAADREGFQHLVAEVSLGNAGIVLGLEVSRLARNNSDWHRLLEICALTDTLILDEDGLYNPGQFNDRFTGFERDDLGGGAARPGGAAAGRHPEQSPAGGTQDAGASRLGSRPAGPGGPGSGSSSPGRAAGLVRHLRSHRLGLCDSQVLPGAWPVVPSAVASWGSQRAIGLVNACPFEGVASVA